MRIVGGKFKGRRLKTPTGRTVRPTSERAREGLFNILAHGRFDGIEGPLPAAAVLDVFAGTGALGLEALSRGAEHVTFIERERGALALIGQNAALLGGANDVTILRLDAADPGPATKRHELVLMDPPYGSGLAAPVLERLSANGWLACTAVVAVELGKDEAFSSPEGFRTAAERRFGAACFVFLRFGDG